MKKGSATYGGMHLLEEELQSQKLFTESILQSLSSGLVVLDSEENIVVLNQEGSRILSSICEQAMDKIRFADIIGNDKAALMTDINNNSRSQNELTLKTRHGEITIGYTTVPRMNTLGDMEGALISISGVSTRKQLNPVAPPLQWQAAMNLSPTLNKFSDFIWTHITAAFRYGTGRSVSITTVCPA